MLSPDDDLPRRYLLGCKGLPSMETEDTKKSFEGLFRKYGLPQAIRSDNGVPFASTRLGRFLAGGRQRLSNTLDTV